MLSRLAVPHFTEVNGALGVLQPEAKSIQMFQVKPRDWACQSGDCPNAPLSGCSSIPMDGNSCRAFCGPTQSEAPSVSSDMVRGDRAFPVGSAGSWWQRDLGKL